MDRRTPTVYLLHGDDDLAVSEFIARLKDKLGDPSTVCLNTQVFSADGLDMAALAEACAAMPFLARRRLIVLQRASAAMTGDPARRERFLALLDGLPPSTALVLVEPQELSQKSPLMKWAESHADQSFVKAMNAPHGPAFVEWLQQRAHQLEGKIDPQAAFLLAELVGDDPRRAEQELAKLLDYVDRARPVETQDVERLTPFGGQSDVFAMVDALGARDGQMALGHLHRLLEDEPALYALAMIIRQFRLLLLAREALDTGRDPRQALRLHPYVASKLSTQARHFTLQQLERIYHQLLEMDLAIKTGKTEDVVALDSLLADLCAA
jgi:DNA polymerase-3 subunit delta